MTSTPPVNDNAVPTLIERLHAHKALSTVPTEELEWLIARGRIEHYAVGDMIAHKGQPVAGMYVILRGHLSHHTDHTGSWRKVLDWRAGEVTGHLPFSRMVNAPGNTVVDEPTEVLFLPHSEVKEMTVVCPHITESLVHVMLDRARQFKSADLQLEKMASLGKLAAGLAHELNNPASAAARSAQMLRVSLDESEAASRALAGVQWTEAQLATLDRARGACFDHRSTNVLGPVERSDREEEIADWLSDHDIDDGMAAPLVETGATLVSLDELAAALEGDTLAIAVRWLAAGCTIRQLARELEASASRIHTLVSAVKRFTYMDRASAPVPLDLAKALGDTVAMLEAKARGKSASVTLNVPPDLPPILGVGGELNQVWMNLIDNAIDAIGDGGHVAVTVEGHEKSVIVHIVDDGPGIPVDVMSRIFEPFFTTKEVGKGTGLGLEMARRLAESNGASLDVESRPGRTDFRVALPIDRTDR